MDSPRALRAMRSISILAVPLGLPGSSLSHRARTDVRRCQVAADDVWAFVGAAVPPLACVLRKMVDVLVRASGGRPGCIHKRCRMSVRSPKLKPDPMHTLDVSPVSPCGRARVTSTAPRSWDAFQCDADQAVVVRLQAITRIRELPFRR
ncbi:hypothetical protein C2E23DRAFT_491693 [Lenzites betulinus]|nr:hypothetical protein C2E23DRAFT_491693 [Lenzites betulinus]